MTDTAERTDFSPPAVALALQVAREDPELRSAIEQMEQRQYTPRTTTPTPEVVDLSNAAYPSLLSRIEGIAAGQDIQVTVSAESLQDALEVREAQMTYSLAEALFSPENTATALSDALVFRILRLRGWDVSEATSPRIEEDGSLDNIHEALDNLRYGQTQNTNSRLTSRLDQMRDLATPSLDDVLAESYPAPDTGPEPERDATGRVIE